MTNTTPLMAGLVAALLCQAAHAADVDPAVAAESGDKVTMKYDALDSETGGKTTFRAAGACKLNIVPAVDLRQNKETIGQTYTGALLAGDISPWMTDGLRQLKNFGYTVSDVAADAPPAADGLTVRTSVTRAYTWQIGLKLFSMVAVKAEFIDPNGVVLQQKYYRSHGDKTNMWGANSEYVTTLNYGLNNLLPFMAHDLQSLCKGEKVAAYSYAGPDGLPVK